MLWSLVLLLVCYTAPSLMKDTLSRFSLINVFGFFPSLLQSSFSQSSWHTSQPSFFQSVQYLGAGGMRHGGRRTAATVARPVLVHGRCGRAVLAQEAAICRKKGPGRDLTLQAVLLTWSEVFKGQRENQVGTDIPANRKVPGTWFACSKDYRLLMAQNSERECTKHV